MNNLPDGWRNYLLGEITTESRVRLKNSGFADLPVFGVNNQIGLTLDSKYKAKNISNYKFIDKNMFAYNPMRLDVGSIGYCFPYLGTGVVSPDYVVFSCRSDLLDPDYMYQYIHSHRWTHWTERAGAGSVRVRIYYKHLATHLIPLPPLPEQRAIADILSTWDDAIALVEALIAALQQRKTGLMQRLLSGAVRFPGFEEEWEEVRLGDVLEIHYGKSPNGIRDDNGRFLIWGTGGIIGRTNEFISNQVAIILGRKGTIDTPYLTKEPFWAIDTTFYCVPDVSVDVDWLYYILGSKKLERYSESSSLPSLSRNTLNTIRIVFPSIVEQKSIGAILQICDQEIQVLENYRSQLQTQKKGLMQRLLTGAVRVRV